jgi:hypothetical protein
MNTIYVSAASAADISVAEEIAGLPAARPAGRAAES